MSYTVLIIDDAENARKNISEYLDASGYEVLEAGSIKEGKNILKQGSADIIILDVNLPDGLGTDLLIEINSQPVRLPVILITGYGDIEMAVEAMKNGAHDFITKLGRMDMQRMIPALCADLMGLLFGEKMARL